MDPNNVNPNAGPRPVERPNRPTTPGQPNAPTDPNAPAQPNAPTPGANGPADARIGRVAGMENTTPEFRQKVADIADRLGMDPQHLMAVMSFETGGSFSPSIRNRTSGATGLIQFMPSTARGLGTSTDALARMDPMQQLDYVEKYLKPYAGKMNSVEDAYMAVLWPAAVGKGPNHVLFSSPSIQYRQNSGLDTNGNGQVSAFEAASKVRARILG
ncbi:MAG: lytic transglycosylase [Deltaproteobacteria bacterium]|nr:MAG: lytic transglycosylase [Deltaproteobacteria bacterium]